MKGSFLRTAVTVTALASAAAFVGYLIGRRTSTPRKVTDSRSTLSDQILGASRHQLASRFGPPVIASAGDYSMADVWYYPLDESRRSAIAIEFQNDTARHVEVITSP